MQPSFETERLLIRPRSEAELEDCLAMDRDPLVTHYVPGPWADPVAHRAFVVERMATAYPDGLGYWSLFPRSDPESFLGWVMVIPYDVEPGEFEIGWRLRREFWGRGFASEAARVVLRHALDTVGLHRVVADIVPENLASARVAEKIGMERVEDRTIGGTLWRFYRAERRPPAEALSPR